MDVPLDVCVEVAGSVDVPLDVCVGVAGSVDVPLDVLVSYASCSVDSVCCGNSESLTGS